MFRIEKSKYGIKYTILLIFLRDFKPTSQLLSKNKSYETLWLSHPIVVLIVLYLICSLCNVVRLFSHVYVYCRYVILSRTWTAGVARGQTVASTLRIAVREDPQRRNRLRSVNYVLIFVDRYNI